MVDVNTPVTNPDLVRAISDMRQNNSPEKQNRMMDEVLKAHFITPVNVSPEPKHDHCDCDDHHHCGCHDHHHDHTTEFKEGTTISFYSIADSAGQHFS